MVLNNLKYNTMKKLLLVATLGVAGFMSANTGSYGTKLNNESQKIDVTFGRNM